MHKQISLVTLIIALCGTSLHALEGNNDGKPQMHQPLSLQELAAHALMKHCAHKPAYFDQLVKAASSMHTLLPLSEQDQQEIHVPAELDPLIFKKSILFTNPHRKIKQVVLSPKAKRILIGEALDKQGNGSSTLYIRHKHQAIGKLATYEGSSTCFPLSTTDKLNGIAYYWQNSPANSDPSGQYVQHAAGHFTEMFEPNTEFSSLVPISCTPHKDYVAFYHKKSEQLGCYFPKEDTVILPQGSLSNPLPPVRVCVSNSYKYTISADGQWFVGCEVRQATDKDRGNWAKILNMDEQVIQPAGHVHKWLQNCLIPENRAASPYISPDNKQVAFLGMLQSNALVYNFNQLFKKGNNARHKYHAVSGYHAPITALVWNVQKSHIITGDNKGNILVQDRYTGKPLKLIECGSYPIASLTIDPTGKYCAMLRHTTQYDDEGHTYMAQLLSIHKFKLAHDSDKNRSLTTVAYHAAKQRVNNKHLDALRDSFSFTTQAMLERIRKQAEKERRKKEISKNAS